MLLSVRLDIMYVGSFMGDCEPTKVQPIPVFSRFSSLRALHWL